MPVAIAPARRRLCWSGKARVESRKLASVASGLIASGRIVDGAGSWTVWVGGGGKEARRIAEPTARPARQPDLPLIAISERREVKVRGPLTPSSRHHRRTAPIRYSICQLFTSPLPSRQRGFRACHLRHHRCVPRSFAYAVWPFDKEQSRKFVFACSSTGLCLS